MSSDKKHPHIERPSVKQINIILKDKNPILCQMYQRIHQLVIDTLPDVLYSVDCKDGQMGYGARQHGYNGWGMAALSVHNKWVSLVFMRGADLEDPDKLLEGSGKKMRHVKMHSPEQVEERRMALQRMIRQASKFERNTND